MNPSDEIAIIASELRWAQCDMTGQKHLANLLSRISGQVRRMERFADETVRNAQEEALLAQAARGAPPKRKADVLQFPERRRP